MSDKIQQILERQASLWEQARQQKSDRVPRTWGRVICLSREFGAGSSVLVTGLTERLGFQCYDQEIVETISRQANIRDKLIQSVDEKTRGGLRDFLSDLFSGDSTAHWRYQEQLFELILSLAHHGDCIIVGRGANFLIPREHSLSLRLIAPREWRIRHMAALRSLSEAEAGDLVDRSEGERSAWIRRTFGHDANNPHHYDLILNSGTLPPETLVALAVRAFQGKFPSSG